MAAPRTLAVYGQRAEDYARLSDGAAPWPDLVAFIAAMPAGSRVLDLGCGPGTASAHMAAAELCPDPVDASAAMVDPANRVHPGIGARLSTFDEITGAATHDGVWASFSLRHAPRADLPRHLGVIARALRPGGRLYIAMNTGTGERRDTLGRFCTFVTAAELHALLRAAGLAVLSTRHGRDRELAGTLDPFLACAAEAPDA